MRFEMMVKSFFCKQPAVNARTRCVPIISLVSISINIPLLLSVILTLFRLLPFEIPDQSILILLTKMIYDCSCRILYAKRLDGSSMSVRIFVHIIPRQLP